MIVDDDKDKLKLLNNFFSLVFSSKLSRIVNVTCQTDINLMPRVLFGVDGLRKLLQKMKLSTVSSPEVVPAAILKNCSGILCSYFSRSFQECVSVSGVFDKVFHALPN